MELYSPHSSMANRHTAGHNGLFLQRDPGYGVGSQLLAELPWPLQLWVGQQLGAQLPGLHIHQVHGLAQGFSPAAPTCCAVHGDLLLHELALCAARAVELRKPLIDNL